MEYEKTDCHIVVTQAFLRTVRIVRTLPFDILTLKNIMT